MKALKSNFYLIKVDNTPVYVGYTNRPIKIRFREHLHDKDFGDGKVTQESLGSMSFDFTWDINHINVYAREVSDRETELIHQYNTQSSVWQKGINGNIGGQTWADVKNFVRTNRDNPKFVGLSEDEVLVYLQREDIVRQYMSDFVSRMNSPLVIYMSTFVNHIEDPVARYMKSFISNSESPIVGYMRGFIHHIEAPVTTYMKSFVAHIESPTARYLHNFVVSIQHPTETYMHNFVSNMQLPEEQYMKHFVSHMNKKG